MITPRKELVGPRSLKSDRLGDMLGFGTFAAVFDDKSNKDQVIKLVQYGVTTILEQEKSVLDTLNCDDK